MSQKTADSSLQTSSRQDNSNKPQQTSSNSNNIQSDGENNPEPTGQKKEEDNDYNCGFKLTIKEKFQEKLKHDETDCVFTVIINEIIEERIRTNYFGEEQTLPPVPDPVANIQDLEQEADPSKNGPSELDRLKSEDEQVKKRIKELLKKRPKKKGLTFELDPNRDKGFILAKRMNQIKQEREKKYVQTKKELEAQRNQLIQSQMTTIQCIENFSMHLARKGNRRYTKEFDESYRLPKIPQQNNFMNETNRSRLDFLGRNRNTIDESGQNYSFTTQKYESVALSARSNYESVKKDKKRDLLREIEILRKSQKITEKYQTRKMACDILIDVIFNAVRLVETKKEFYFNAPPKPVHEMIRNYKDKNGKTVWIPGSKPEKFRINVHLGVTKKERSEGNKSSVSDQSERVSDQSENVEESDESRVKKLPNRMRQISQTIDVMLNKKTDKSEGSLDEEESEEKEREREREREDEKEKDDDGDDKAENEQNEQGKQKKDEEGENEQNENDEQISNARKVSEGAQAQSQVNPEIAIYL